MAGWVALLGKAQVSCTAFPSGMLPCTAHTGRAQQPEAQAKAWAVLRGRSWREQHVLGTLEQPTPPAKLCYWHQGDSLILLSKELKKLSSLSSAKRVTTECYCICTANAIIELSIPQGHHSTESDAEISDIIFQRT